MTFDALTSQLSLCCTFILGLSGVLDDNIKLFEMHDYMIFALDKSSSGC